MIFFELLQILTRNLDFLQLQAFLQILIWLFHELSLYAGKTQPICQTGEHQRYCVEVWNFEGSRGKSLYNLPSICFSQYFREPEIPFFWVPKSVTALVYVL